jgi:hypothetical protein
MELVYEYDRTHPDGAPRRRRARVASPAVATTIPARASRTAAEPAGGATGASRRTVSPDNNGSDSLAPRARSPVVAIPRADPITGEPFLDRLRPRRRAGTA